MPSSRRITIEVLIVLAVSVGAAALRSILTLAMNLSLRIPLNLQTTALTPGGWSPSKILTLAYQAFVILQPLSWAVLVLFLLANVEPRIANPIASLGIDRRWSSLGWGLLLALVVGVVGLVWYSFSVWIGINTVVRTSTQHASFTQYVVYVLSALENAGVEEIIVLGYLFTRLRQLQWTPGRIVVATAVLRGTYHLYQGFGGFIGNLVMGLLFGWLYVRYRRLTPLIAAHAFIDLATFFGAALLLPHLGWLQHLPGL